MVRSYTTQNYSYLIRQLTVTISALVALLFMQAIPQAYAYTDCDHLLTYVINNTPRDVSGTIKYSHDHPAPVLSAWTVSSGQSLIISDYWIDNIYAHADKGHIGVTFDAGTLFPFYVQAVVVYIGDHHWDSTGISSFWIQSSVKKTARCNMQVSNPNLTWIKSFYGGAQGFFAYSETPNLTVMHDRGASGHIKFTLTELDEISSLQGQWYTADTSLPIFIDVASDDKDTYKLSLVPGSTSKDWNKEFTSLTYYGVPPGSEVAGTKISYNMPGLPFMNEGNSITYALSRATDGSYSLTQTEFSGFPAVATKKTSGQSASIAWWKKAKKLIRK